MSKCQECGHDCHCNGECGYVDWCGCEDCKCESIKQDENIIS